MTGPSYDINGLVHVEVSSEVRPEIVREIDFQIGYFKTTNVGDPDRPRIRVYPLSYWSGRVGKKENEDVSFYACRGRPGVNLVDGTNRLGIAREDSGFSIYADYPNFLINLYIQLLIVPLGYTMVHAAGYLSSEGTVTLVAGVGGIGKTAILGHAVREHGLKYLGDDVVIVSRSGSCIAFPRAFVLKSYHREVYAETFRRLSLPRWNLYKVKRFVVENAPFVGVFKGFLRRTGLYYRVTDVLRPQPHLATVTSEDIFGKDAVVTSGCIGRVVYLDRTDCTTLGIGNIRREELSNRLLSIIHYEWKDFLAHLMSLGALTVVDLGEYFTHVIKNLDGALQGRELLYLRVPKNARPGVLMDFLDSKGLF